MVERVHGRLTIARRRASALKKPRTDFSATC